MVRWVAFAHWKLLLQMVAPLQMTSAAPPPVLPVCRMPVSQLGQLQAMVLQVLPPPRRVLLLGLLALGMLRASRPQQQHLLQHSRLCLPPAQVQAWELLRLQ